MSKKIVKLTTKLEPGRKKRHGGYTYLSTGRLPEHRKHIEKYLTAARENLIKDLGPTEEELTTAQIIIIDRIVSKLGIVRCIEEHIRENSVMRGQELAPSLKTSYLAYNNSIRLDLQALGLDKRQVSEVLTPWELAKKAEEEDRRKKNEQDNEEN